MTIYEILIGIAAVLTAGMPGYLAYRQGKRLPDSTVKLILKALAEEKKRARKH